MLVKHNCHDALWSCSAKDFSSLHGRRCLPMDDVSESPLSSADLRHLQCNPRSCTSHQEAMLTTIACRMIFSSTRLAASQMYTFK